MSTTRISLIRPDDWHLHLRDGEALKAVAAHSARQFARAIIMPNLRPPVTTVAAAAEYRQRILAALPAGSDFEPLMTLYLTDNTPADEIRRAADSGFVKAVKLYPAGATTNSDAGVTDLAKCDAALAEMDAGQRLRDATGASHAAGFLVPGQGLIALREDVGRHNALDKLLGHGAQAGMDWQQGFVLISSRASYEMVAKAAMLGIGCVVAVSAPTALAARLAEQAGITLVGFARPGQCSIYSQPQWVAY